MSPQTEPFRPLLDRYRAVLFDSYGVLRDSSQVYPEVPDLLASLPHAWVVTNDASKSAVEIGAPFGVGPERIVSSGGVASAYLAEHHAGRRVAYLGPPEAAFWLTEAGCEAAAYPDVDDAWVDVLAVMDDRDFEWERDLNRAVNLLRDRPGLPFLLPNPDLVFPAGPGRVGIASGGLTALLEAASGARAKRFGKPGAPIFDQALTRARAALGDPLLEPGEVLMVGDTLETDIAGASTVGIRTALVLSGNTTAGNLETAVARVGVTPDHLVLNIFD